ncbi:N-acetyltransferase [bacterium]|nr:N-acetyltransferase [bacterium]
MAEIDFEKIDEKTYNISHTFVDDSLRGQGIGSELVEKAMTYLISK